MTMANLFKVTTGASVVREMFSVAHCSCHAFKQDSPNYVPGMLRPLSYNAGDANKPLVKSLVNKHFTQVVVKFANDGKTKGACDWTCEVADGKLIATMHWNFEAYMVSECR